MNFHILKKLICISAIICAVAVFDLNIASASEDEIGNVKKIKGIVSIIRNDKTITAKLGFKLRKNDLVQTGQNASIGLTFNDGTVLSLGSNSAVVLDEFVFAPKQGKFSIVFRMLKGTAAYLSGLIAKLSPESVVIETPEASIGVRGTKFVVKVEDQKRNYDMKPIEGGPFM